MTVRRSDRVEAVIPLRARRRVSPVTAVRGLTALTRIPLRRESDGIALVSCRTPPPAAA
jgi:hypothetical protein